MELDRKKEELISILDDLYKQESSIICPAIWNGNEIYLDLGDLEKNDQKLVYDLVESIYKVKIEEKEKDIKAKIRAREIELKKLL